MFRSIVCALALSAVLLSPAIATAKGGGGGGGVSGSKGGSAPVSRQQYTDSKPQIGFKKMKILNCHKYPRGNGQGGTVMVTVCS